MLVVDGQSIAEVMRENVRVQARGLGLHLAAVLAGDDEGLRQFVKIKKKVAESCGIMFSSYDLRGQATSHKVIETIQFLNRDESVHGIFVELPLPGTIPRDAVLSAIAPEKDVDALSSLLQEAFYADECLILPPAVRALEAVFQEYEIDLHGKKAAVFGPGFLVGKPVAHWLKKQGASVSVIDIDDKEPEKISLAADIVVASAGDPRLVKGDMVKDGAIVIDFGYNHEKEAVVGDIDTSSVSRKASLLAPVPGGMGPIVVAAVLENLVKLAIQQR